MGACAEVRIWPLRANDIIDSAHTSINPIEINNFYEHLPENN